VLQCVAVCCSVLQYAAVCCNVLQYLAVCCNLLQSILLLARRAGEAVGLYTCANVYTYICTYIYIKHNHIQHIYIYAHTYT